LAQRQLASRYKESSLGLLWALVNPLILLAIYAYIFGVVFNSKWTAPPGNEAPAYALIIFSGLIIFNLFSEIVNSSAYLVSSNAALIKRTSVSSFVLPIATVLSALFTFGLRFCAFCLLYVVLEGAPPWTAILLPVLLIPFLVLCLGLAYLVSSIAAYVRDVQQLLPLATTFVLFTAPVFFDADRAPRSLASIRFFNPVYVLVTSSKDLIFWGRLPTLAPVLAYSLVAAVVLAVGVAVFSVARRGFADVI